MEVLGRGQQNLASGLENALRTDNKGNRPPQGRKGEMEGAERTLKVSYTVPFDPIWW